MRAAPPSLYVRSTTPESRCSGLPVIAVPRNLGGQRDNSCHGSHPEHQMARIPPRTRGTTPGPVSPVEAAEATLPAVELGDRPLQVLGPQVGEGDRVVDQLAVR